MSDSPHSLRIDQARRVIEIEMAGLTGLLDTIDASFDAAVEEVLKTEKYLIVVGVGKSGHIGRKIAASFASTGTPSFFLHPTEASHGDLGMITNGCSLLVLSNSGESRELRDVLSFAASRKIPVIAVTQRKDSHLGRTSTHTLLLPDLEEACPNGLAPTTSTTCALALCDALVVTVMSERGFTTDDFGQHHPAGRLGLGLQSVAQYLALSSEPVTSVVETAPMSETVLAISSGGKGCVAVLNDQNQFCGMITDGDLRRAMRDDFMQLTAKDVMTPSPFTISTDMRMREVVKAFSDRRIGNAFVVEDGLLLGQIDLKTLLADGYV